MENQTRDTSDDDLLKAFDSETTTSNATYSTIAGADATDNLSNILGEINPNNCQEDDLLQILNGNTGQQASHRRSSILKVTEKMAEFRRTSRRVSWAQTYQYKQLHSDGTTVISSQELNKYGPEPAPSGARQSSEFEPFVVANENVEPSSQEGPLSALTAPLLSNNPQQEQVLRKVKGKKRESFTRILSKFYNKDNEKDCQTVINTAVNRFGIDPTATDLNGILNPANPNPTELLKNAENATLTGFLQSFAEQQQQQTRPSAVTAKAAVIDEVANLPLISPISGNIKTNLHVIDDTMNVSTFQQVCNSTRIAGDQDQSNREFWENAIKETSGIEESIHQEKGTIHETTMMDMDLVDSSGSNDKITKQSTVASVTNQTKADAEAEKQKEENEFLALLKGNAEDPSEMATDTFEFSFQLPQTNNAQTNAADTEQMTQGLTSLLANNMASDAHSPAPDANLSEMPLTHGLTSILAEDKASDAPSLLPDASQTEQSLTQGSTSSLADDMSYDTHSPAPDIMLSEHVLTQGSTSILTDDMSFDANSPGPDANLSELPLTHGLTSLLAEDKASDAHSPEPDSNLSEQVLTHGLTSIFGDDKANDAPSPSPDATLAEQVLTQGSTSILADDMSFDTPSPAHDATLTEQGRTHGLTSILANDKVNNVPSSASDASLSKQLTAALAMEPVPDSKEKEGADSFMRQLLDVNAQSEAKAVPIETEVSVQSPLKPAAIEMSLQKKSLDLSSNSSALKRPYDFTLLDSDPMMEQQLKFPKQLSISNTASLRKSVAFPSVLAPISRSRIPILPVCQRPAVGASTVILRGLGSTQPKFQQPLQQQQLPNPFESTSSSSSSSSSGQRTTCVLSSLNRTVTKVTANLPTTTNSAMNQRQIEMDFNQSGNRSINNSRNDSTGLDSPIATRIVENCIRKSIGFGMRNRLIEKARQLNLQREQATVQLVKTAVVPLEKPPQAVEAPSKPVDAAEVDVTMSTSAAIDESAPKTDVPVEVEEEGENADDGVAKEEPALPVQTTESPSNDVQMEDNSEESAEKNIIEDTSNFSMIDFSLDSIKLNDDDFDDELDDSDTTSVTLLNQKRTLIDNFMEEASQSIANASILSFSDRDTLEKKEDLESTLNVTVMPLDETLGMLLNETVNMTKNFSEDPFSDSLTAEWLEEYKAKTAGNSLYRCISTLDFSNMHIRIHEMNANSCMVRFLWGTLEVRINFGTAKTEGAVRPMAFDTITRLSNNKPIPYEVMRGLTDLAKYDSDELFMSFDEAHRPFLNLAHNYVNTRFHEEYHELVKKYPDSSKLADLLRDLANIVETARKLCVELQHMYEKEFMELMPPMDDCFKFKVRLLGVRLVSHFYLEFAFDPMKYPYEVIRPKIIVPSQDQHLYPIDQFQAGLLMVKPGNYNYLEGLVKGAKCFVAALRKVLLKNLKYQKQKAELEGVHLAYSPANNTNS